MEEFVLKEEHIKLLKRAYWEWQECETGGPAMNPKRPYGNSSVASDVAEILGMFKPCDKCGHDPGDEGLSSMMQEKAMAFHYETEKALAVILESQSFEVGIYQKVDYKTPWTKVA